MPLPGSKDYRVKAVFDLESTGFVRGLRDISQEIDKVQRNARENFGALQSTLGAVNRNILIILGTVTVGFGTLTTVAARMSGEFERLRVTFETLAGSAEAADKLIRDIKDFAAKTPLQVKDVQEAATMMLGFGYSIDEVIPKLQLFGEAAAALRVPLEQIIRVREFLAAGQFRTVMLAPLGITRQELESYGVIFGKSGELVSSAEEAVAAFETLLEDRFAGLFDKVFGTIQGRVSNIIDQVELMFASLGDAIKPLVIEVMDWLESILGRLRKFFDENQEVVLRAFRTLADNAKRYLAPVLEGIKLFLAEIERDPEILVRFAENVNKVVNALVGLLIINTILLLVIDLTTKLGLLRIALYGVGTAGAAASVSAAFSGLIGLLSGPVGLIALILSLTYALGYLAYTMELIPNIREVLQVQGIVMGIAGGPEVSPRGPAPSTPEAEMLRSFLGTAVGAAGPGVPTAQQIDEAMESARVNLAARIPTVGELGQRFGAGGGRGVKRETIFTRVANFFEGMADGIQEIVQAVQSGSYFGLQNYQREIVDAIKRIFFEETLEHIRDMKEKALNDMERLRAEIQKDIEEKRIAVQQAIADAEKAALLAYEQKLEDLAKAAAEPLNRVFRSLRNTILEGAHDLAASAVTGDIAVALQGVFSAIGLEISRMINKYIAPKGSGMGLQIAGAVIGGVVGAGISLIGSLFGGKGGVGTSPNLPMFAYVVNFPEQRLGAYLPFTFLASGRAEAFDVDYRGASLDRLRGGRRLGFHYGV